MLPAGSFVERGRGWGRTAPGVTYPFDATGGRFSHYVPYQALAPFPSLLINLSLFRILVACFSFDILIVMHHTMASFHQMKGNESYLLAVLLFHGCSVSLSGVWMQTAVCPS